MVLRPLAAAGLTGFTSLDKDEIKWKFRQELLRKNMTVDEVWMVRGSLQNIMEMFPNESS